MSNDLSSVIDLNNFNYSILNAQTAEFLKQKETNMSVIISNAYTEIGKELKEAQDELSKHGYGCFEEWYTSLGFKKDQVYRWIGRHELIVANCEKRELIEELPISLTYEISKPSVNPTLKQHVLDGDIKTHKEYKQLEQQLKQTDIELQGERKAKQALLDLQNEQKNIVPEHILEQISNLKKSLSDSERDKSSHIKMIAQLQDEKQKLDEYIKSDQFELLETKQKEEIMKSKTHVSMFDLQFKIQSFITQAAPSLYLQGAMAFADRSVKRELLEAVKGLEWYVNNLKEFVQFGSLQSNKKEFIDIN